MIENISDYQIEVARKVIEDHKVKPLNKEGALESLVFCIASQATRWEIASKIIYALRRSSHGNEKAFTSWEDLTSKDNINRIVRENRWRFAYNERFDSAIDYFRNLESGWWMPIVEADSKTREKYCAEIRWLSRKTFSFWSICLGGTNLLALDVYVLRGLKDLDIEMNSHFFTPKSRNVGVQKVRKTPSAKEYIIFENSAREIFSHDERFLMEDGRVNMALVDGVLWWNGANRYDSNQLGLFGSGMNSFILPYSGYSFSNSSGNSP